MTTLHLNNGLPKQVVQRPWLDLLFGPVAASVEQPVIKNVMIDSRHQTHNQSLSHQGRNDEVSPPVGGLRSPKPEFRLKTRTHQVRPQAVRVQPRHLGQPARRDQARRQPKDAPLRDPLGLARTEAVSPFAPNCGQHPSPEQRADGERRAAERVSHLLLRKRPRVQLGKYLVPGFPRVAETLQADLPGEDVARLHPTLERCPNQFRNGPIGSGSEERERTWCATLARR